MCLPFTDVPCRLLSKKSHYRPEVQREVRGVLSLRNDKVITSINIDCLMTALISFLLYFILMSSERSSLH